MIITNTSPGNFLTDGPYVDLVAPPPPIPTGPATGLIAIIGAANYGPVNTPTYFNDPSSLFNAFGNGTTLGYSLVDEALQAMPECQLFVGVRVTDGTDTSAVINITDGSAGNVIVLTAKYTGTYQNAATALVSLVSGTSSVKPVYNITISSPGVSAEVFTNIIGYSSSAYSAATFQANALAAINGTLANQPGSLRWTATAGASTIAPTTGTSFTASGGTNGTTSLTATTCIGTDGITGRTGLYTLRGIVQGAQVFIAQNTTATTGATLVSFASSENCSALIAFPSLTATNTEISTRATNNLIAPNLFLASDWTWAYDQVSQTTFLHSPIGPTAAIIAAQPPWMYPGGKPAGAQGKLGIISTDRNGNPNTNPPSGSSPISVAEAGQRQQAGILYLTNNPNLYFQNAGYGLPHGMASDGKTLISDTRMTQSIAVGIQSVLGNYVGSMIAIVNGKLIIVGPNGGPANPQGAINAYLSSMTSGRTPQIAAFSNTLSAQNNSVVSVQQGFLIANIFVQTLSAAKFILAFTQVGNTVNIPAVQISQAS